MKKSYKTVLQLFADWCAEQRTIQVEYDVEFTKKTLVIKYKEIKEKKKTNLLKKENEL